jgi:NAD(P)-dependent dehydrogenase (short-subunit alcohol dehydrogenase family)
MPDLTGKTILITGAGNGIGQQTALELARMHARLLLHDKSLQHLDKTCDLIRSEAGNANLALYPADFSSLAEVKAIANEVITHEKHLDVLVNNAGIYVPKPTLSADGFELSFAVNHLVHFLLTLLLLEKIKQSTPASIVVVASSAHSAHDIDYNFLYTLDGYEGWEAYSQSKLANVLFTYYLADYLKDSGVTANCLHPGVVDTYLLRSAWPDLQGISVQAGAATSVFLASSPDVEGVTSKYFSEQKPISSHQVTYNKKTQERLWKFSMQIVEKYYE